MDSKGEGIYSIHASEGKKKVGIDLKDEAITGVSPSKNINDLTFFFYFASTFSKLQQTTNQLTTALPSTGHLGAPPSTS